MSRSTHFSRSKLALVLRKLSKSSFKRFGKWLSSPFLNRQEKLNKLYELLSAYHPDFEDLHQTKEELFDQLFQEEKQKKCIKNKAKRIRSLMTDLLKQVESYWINDQLNKNEDLKLKLFGDALLEHHLFEIYFKTSKSRIEYYEGLKNKGKSDFLRLYEVYADMYFKPESSFKNTAELMPNPLLKASQYLDQFYLIAKLQIQSEIEERKQIVGKPDLPLFLNKDLLNWAESWNNPAIQFYLINLRQGIKSEIEGFFFTKRLFLSTNKMMSKDDQRTILLLLINKLSRCKFQDDRTKYKELFELHKLGLENDSFFEGGKMTTTSFANIITVANLVGESQFAFNFLESYASSLQFDLQQDAFYWALAHIHYYQSEIGESFDILQKRRFKSRAFVVRTRVLRLQIYFDTATEDNTFFEVFVDYSYAFEQYLRRDTESPPKRRDFALKFIQLTRKLILLWNARDKKQEQIEQYKLNLKQEKNIIAKIWLQERAARFL